MYKKIQTYNHNTKLWTTTEFLTRTDYTNFLLSCYKEPGKYEFDECSLEFNKEGKKFLKDKLYNLYPIKSKDYVIYWDEEKDKCRNGVIYKYNGKTWFLTKEYYMWLNFLPIYNKEIKLFKFPDIRDTQYHLALYEEIGEQSYKHGAILKKRQIASSYFHAAKLLNGFWFEEGFVGKIAASLKDYINEKGTWRFLEEYRNFLNANTAWYRPCNPDKTLNWEQKIEVTMGGRKKDIGLKSVILGYGLDKDPTNGVGGPCSIFFHEEAGIAPRMDETIEYLLPALKSGMIYTGYFCAAGSVGDLDQCKPLKEMIMNPDSKDILAFDTDLYSESKEIRKTGLFIPEQWSMVPYIDQYGNSKVENAYDAIMEERKIWKKTLKSQDYQLRVSQKPVNIEEAFASRKDSPFPLYLVSKQIRRIEDKEYFSEYVDLFRNEKNEIEAKKTSKLPIMEFPISTNLEDKSGSIIVYERPIPDMPFGTYYASVDPVSEGKTTTSQSLCSIIVYKNPIEISLVKEDGTIEQKIEHDKIVCTWTGRFDDLQITHQRLELIIEWYNAWTIIENNVSLFIQYMMHRNKQKYLVPKNQILFLKDLQANMNVFQDYGWKNVGSIFKTNLISYGSQFMSEELDKETTPDGTIVKIVHGIERIPDIMLLKEAQAYYEGLNVDRLVSYCSLIAFAKVQQANRGYTKKTEYEKPDLHNSNKNSKFSIDRSPFKLLGRQPGNVNSGTKKEVLLKT